MAIVPPPDRIPGPIEVVASEYAGSIAQYLNFFSPTDKKGRYQHFDELRFRIPERLDKNLVWSLVKDARERQMNWVIHLGDPLYSCGLVLTPQIQKAISETDRNATSASLEWISSKIGEASQFKYLLKDLIEDESISSSQLEGAATTTRVAKELLKRKRKPRSIDEKMIVGNFKMMTFAWENRSKPLTVELIRDLHRVGVDGIDDEAYHPGTFRRTDDVYVVNSDDEIVHTPPKASGLKERIRSLANWANQNHDDIDCDTYLHPLIKGMILHFAIGYEHPFRDGNGRVARALFYWYMFKNDFAAFRYIAISVLLKQAPVKYGKSYIYTETDDMDLTYFLDYQSGIIIRAIEKFKKAYLSSAEKIQEFNTWLWKSGLYNKLSDKQRTVFQVAKNDPEIHFTTRNVQSNLSCSYNTASSVLNGLVERKLFSKTRVGREWVYKMVSKDQIMSDWS